MLITCKECNKKISSKAESCPHCGAPRSAFMGDQSESGSSAFQFARRYARWLIAAALLIILAIAKPSAADFEQKLHRDIMLALAQQEIKKDDDIVTGLFKLGCSLSRSECAAMLRKQMVVETRNYIFALYAKAHNDNGEVRKYVGMLRNWWCWNGS